ncbi:MAG: uroporphyrinogen decarboxylase family protein [Deltaproteobacteria bacterium]
MSKTGKELYDERQKRVQDAIALRVPDRVPVWFQDASFFPAKYTGMTFQEAMYDSDKIFAAYKKTFIDFEPDVFFNPGHALHTPGAALDVLECKQVRLPGQGIPVNHSFQFVEDEYMKEEEYDEFLDDPTAFTIVKYLPRIHKKLKPLETIPPIRGLLLGYFGMPLSAGFVAPEIVGAIQAFRNAGVIVQRHQEKAEAFVKDMADLGFPLACGAITLAPFDLIGDTLRGLRGILMDMYRCPDKLLAAIDKVTPLMIDLAVAQTEASGCPGVFIPLHKGSDGFMSLKQYETFYWPSLKKLMLAFIDKRLTPCPFFEGIHTQRWEYMADLPKGKILGFFDSTDIYKAKEIIGKTMCMSGFMPLSLLQTGTPEKVKDYAKKLIDVVGKDGGFIMGPKSAMDEANPELVKVWFDFTKDYGVYR